MPALGNNTALVAKLLDAASKTFSATLQRLSFCNCQAYNPASMDDQELVQQCLQRRPEAQRHFYERFAGPMLGVCYRYTKSMTDAEDV